MPILETPNSDTAVEAFRQTAQEYCHLIVADEQSPARGFVVEVHGLLVSVYGRILTLPPSDSIHPDDDGSAHTRSETVGAESEAHEFRALVDKLGESRHYLEVFDPWDKSDNRAVMGDLADDLWDIYNGLRAGLRLWSQGSREYALWEWRFGFESHWGEHVTGAIRALYMLARRHDGLWG